MVASGPALACSFEVSALASRSVRQRAPWRAAWPSPPAVWDHWMQERHSNCPSARQGGSGEERARQRGAPRCLPGRVPTPWPCGVHRSRTSPRMLACRAGRHPLPPLPQRNRRHRRRIPHQGCSRSRRDCSRLHRHRWTPGQAIRAGDPRGCAPSHPPAIRWPRMLRMRQAVRASSCVPRSSDTAPRALRQPSAPRATSRGCPSGEGPRPARCNTGGRTSGIRPPPGFRSSGNSVSGRRPSSPQSVRGTMEGERQAGTDRFWIGPW